MASPSELSDEQKAKIQLWADEGATLGEIQVRLREDLGMAVTFLDTRILLAELGISLKEEVKKTVQPEAEAGAADETAPGAVPGEAEADEGAVPVEGEEPPEGAPAGMGKADVVMDEVTAPGMLATGQVTFSDGEKAKWNFDQMGRLGLDPETEGYRPNEEDVVAFQDELQRIASRL
jgi:hypothetical protein